MPKIATFNQLRLENMIASISVIIPVYHGEKFILEALSSVCAQTVLPLEIVVADDASTDNTRALVESFAKKSNVPVKLCVMNKNSGGPYAPASMAFNSTLGDYVCILDADDIFAPEAFENYMKMFQKCTLAGIKIGLATSDYETFDDVDGEVVLPSYFDQQSAVIGDFFTGGVFDDFCVISNENAKKLYSGSFCIPFKGMLSRDAWESLGGPNLKYKHVCDVEFVWRLIIQSRYLIAVTKKRLVKVRVSQGSMSKNKIELGFELARLMNSILKELKEDSLRKIVRGREQKELYDIVYEAKKNKKYSAVARSGFRYITSRIGGLLD